MKTTIIRSTTPDFKDILGNYCLIEGDATLTDANTSFVLKNVLKTYLPTLSLFNIYREPEQLSELIGSDIKSIVIQTTFTNASAIKAFTETILNMDTNIKNVFFIFDYGIPEMLMMLENTNISFFRIAGMMYDVKLQTFELEDEDRVIYSDYKLSLLESSPHHESKQKVIFSSTSEALSFMNENPNHKILVDGMVYFSDEKYLIWKIEEGRPILYNCMPSSFESCFSISNGDLPLPISYDDAFMYMVKNPESQILSNGRLYHLPFESLTPLIFCGDLSSEYDPDEDYFYELSSLPIGSLYFINNTVAL